MKEPEKSHGIDRFDPVALIVALLMGDVACTEDAIGVSMSLEQPPDDGGAEDTAIELAA